jgi:drug/metabolite transporter (DMT)-like permease
MVLVNARPEKIARAVSTMVATTFAMSFGDAAVKYVSSDLTVWQLYVLRSALAVPLIIALLLLGAGPRRIAPLSPGWAAVRSLLLMLMWVAFYAALTTLSLPVVAAAYYTAPLFITVLSAAIVGDPVGPRRWLAVIVGFGGVLVIVKPGSDAFSWSTLPAILSAVLYALAAIVTRAKCIDERPLVLSLALNVAFLLTGTIVSAALAWWEPSPAIVDLNPFLLGHWSVMSARNWEIITMLAVLIIAVSAGVAKAYQSAPSAIIATFDYSYLVFAAFWSLAIFGEPPGIADITGMILIAGAGVLTIRSSRARA